MFCVFCEDTVMTTVENVEVCAVCKDYKGLITVEEAMKSGLFDFDEN